MESILVLVLICMAPYLLLERSAATYFIRRITPQGYLDALCAK